MRNEIQAVLKEEQLRQKIMEAETQHEVVTLLATALAEKGHNFSAEEISKDLTIGALKAINELNSLNLPEPAVGALEMRNGSWNGCCISLPE